MVILCVKPPPLKNLLADDGVHLTTIHTLSSLFSYFPTRVLRFEVTGRIHCTSDAYSSL